MTPSSLSKPHSLSAMIFGLVFVGVIAFCSYFLAKLPFFSNAGLGVLTLAIILGMLIGNTFFNKIAKKMGSGVDFSKNRLLRLGIILYGFGVTLQDIGGVGARAVIADVIIVAGVFFLGMFLGRRLFKLDKDSCVLISAGSAICGAAAVMATEPVVKAQAYKVTMAVATVVVFGTVSLFLYPLLYPLLGFDAQQFGIYIGSTVHEVAQTVAAGKAVSEETATNAVIVKMIRVMLLVPFLLLLSVWQAKREKPAQHKKSAYAAIDTHARAKTKIMIPWFAVFFICASLIASLHIIPPAILEALKLTATLFLAMAMTALGLRTHYSSLRQAGLKPLGLAFCLFLFLVIGGGFINLLIVTW